jgi:GH24 family phage-related lysozyme (muramidase)
MLAIADTGRRVDERGLQFATQPGFDSFEKKLYNDPQNCTIGYGHLVHLGPCAYNRSPDDVLGRAGDYQKQLKKEMPYLKDVDGRLVPRSISRDEARNLLREDAGKTDAIVNRNFNTPLGQNQYDALWDFTFNGCLRGSLGRKVIAAVNRRDFATVESLLPRCNKGLNKHGKLVVFPGLVRRRDSPCRCDLDTAATDVRARSRKRGPASRRPPQSRHRQLRGDVQAAVPLGVPCARTHVRPRLRAGDTPARIEPVGEVTVDQRLQLLDVGPVACLELKPGLLSHGRRRD